VADAEIEIVGPFRGPETPVDRLAEDIPPPDPFPPVEVPQLPVPDDPNEV
jgi:hypothetical protein